MASLLREASVHALREIIKADPEGVHLVFG